MNLKDFKPNPKLVTEEHIPIKPRFPVIDAHNHLRSSFGGDWPNRPVQDLLDVMDEAGVEAIVDLDGGWGEDILEGRLGTFKAAAPERFYMFGGVAWNEWSDHGNRFGDWAANRLRAQVALGAQGLKIWKNLGLHVKDQKGSLVAVDDERLAPLWETAGELKVPVLVHVADPAAFFDPLDASNERWEELSSHSDWHFPNPPFPSFIEIVEQFRTVVRRHKNTVFIGAHVGCYAENLRWVGALIKECPNFYVDISERLAELGRQPYTARRFFIEHANRILFGTDVGVDIDWYRLYYRFLETADESFNYGLGDTPKQGRWRVHGMFLPDDVLEKIYRTNALAVLPR